MAKKTLNPIDKYVGSRVRMRRKILGMSQTKLADAIGLTFQQVQKYEYGTNRIGSSRLMQMANVLQVPPTFFFEDASGQRKADGSASSPTYVSEFLATSDGLALTRAFMRLSSKKLRRSIVNIVREIAGE
ncbi:MAG TPA: helix-turn-helix transcriptional regulator [Pseudolabrys sp.]|jgi:transcriptional regulator with XRE-family HTH domain